MDRYEPPSDFLNSLAQSSEGLDGQPNEDTVRRLLLLMQDDHDANRDWATFLLAQSELDTPEVRNALVAASDDEHPIVRAEAIWGLAQRDNTVALPLVLRELREKDVALPVFEAAEIVGNPSLIHELEEFLAPSDDPHFDRAVEQALTACKAAR